jgi:DNA-binding transcriptional MocR family regulator
MGKRTARRPLPRFQRAAPRAGERESTAPALAEHYGVNRATVTRTLHILADEGLVRTVPQWGTFRAGDSGAPRHGGDGALGAFLDQGFWRVHGK